MPYIKREDRAPIDEHLLALSKQINSPGEFNYAVSKLAHLLLVGKLNYTNINTLIGAMECAKLELYRIIAAPYEDAKRYQNGCVSGLTSMMGDFGPNRHYEEGK